MTSIQDFRNLCVLKLVSPNSCCVCIWNVLDIYIWTFVQRQRFPKNNTKNTWGKDTSIISNSESSRVQFDRRCLFRSSANQSKLCLLEFIECAKGVNVVPFYWLNTSLITENCVGSLCMFMFMYGTYWKNVVKQCLSRMWGPSRCSLPISWSSTSWPLQPFLSVALRSCSVLLYWWYSA